MQNINFFVDFFNQIVSTRVYCMYVCNIFQNIYNIIVSNCFVKGKVKKYFYKYELRS